MKSIPPALYIWASKYLLNFAGTALRMNQMGCWDSEMCRCYGECTEDDTFHIFECQNETIDYEREEVFDLIFGMINRLDLENDI